MSPDISERPPEEAIECALLQSGTGARVGDRTAVRETSPPAARNRRAAAQDSRGRTATGYSAPGRGPGRLFKDMSVSLNSAGAYEAPLNRRKRR